MTQSNWKWIGFAGHFCLRHDCLFHLTTQVGDYLVSSVGYLLKDGQLKELSQGKYYETFVFRVEEGVCDCGCELPSLGEHVESIRYARPNEATAGHIELCQKYDSLTLTNCEAHES